MPKCLPFWNEVNDFSCDCEYDLVESLIVDIAASNKIGSTTQAANVHNIVFVYIFAVVHFFKNSFHLSIFKIVFLNVIYFDLRLDLVNYAPPFTVFEVLATVCKVLTQRNSSILVLDLHIVNRLSSGFSLKFLDNMLIYSISFNLKRCYISTVSIVLKCHLHFLDLVQ